jgi:hypothetical protein
VTRLYPGFQNTFTHLGARECIGKSSPIISAKPDGVGGCASVIDPNRRTIWIADARRDDGKRFVVRADEKLTAFLELELATRACGEYN